MQMRKMYATTNRAKRASQLRQAAIECEKAGFLYLAWVNFTEADILDPWVDEEG